MSSAAFWFEMIGRLTTGICAVTGLIVIMKWAVSPPKKNPRR